MWMRTRRAGRGACFRRAAVSAVAILVATGAAEGQTQGASGPRTEEVQAFEIPAQPLAGAIIAFAEQANLVLIAPQALADGKTAPAVSGEFTPAQALGRLLEGSGLGFEIKPDGRLILRAKDAGAARANDNPGHADGAIAPVRMAQREEQADAPEPAVGGEETPDEDAPAEVEEIVITGSHIRGAAPVGANMIVLDRADIEKTGFGTTQQVIQSLPQFSQIGANEDTLASGEGRGFSNFGAGASANLRGIGPDSTLTLLNGRRLSRGGFGTFVDISNIPLTAIERVEVVPDGSSALYGSDAIGGVVNIILRKDFQGVEPRARIGTVTEGDLQEFQVGLVLGTVWEDGNGLVSYEYHKRDNLKARHRDFITFDLRPFGGDDFRREGGNPGNITNFVETCAIPEGQDGTDLSPDDLLCGVASKVDPQEGADILPDQERHSVFVSGQQAVADWIELFVEGGFSQREFSRLGRVDNITFFVPDTNPFFVGPFGGASGVFVQRALGDDFGTSRQFGKVRSANVASGATIDLPFDWKTTIFGSYSRERTRERFINAANQLLLAEALADPNPETAFNPFADGSNTNPETIERVRGFTASNQIFEIWQVSGKADGTLVTLPGGEVKLAVGGEYREESSQATTKVFLFTPDLDINRSTQKRKVKAGFGEILIPIVGRGNRRPGIERLEVSAAGRIEDDNNFGTTKDPKVGALWKPVPGLSLRGTFGTSFKAPVLRDLDENVNRTFFDFVVDDPMSPTGSTNILVRSGSNAELGPEEGRTWSVGFDLTPAFLAGFRLEATYFDIEIKDRILDGLNEIFTILTEEDRFAARIMRDPDPAAVQTLLNDPDFVNVFGSAPEDIGAIVDLRLKNIGRIRTNGADFTASYGFETHVGRFDFRVNGSVFAKFKRAESPTSPAFSVLDTLRNPVDWRMRNSVSWNHQGFSATAFLNYTDNFTDDESVPERKVNSWATIDLTLAYRTEDRPAKSWLRNIDVSLSVQNLLDDAPPFVNNRRGFGFDPQNADPLNRFIALQISKGF